MFTGLVETAGTVLQAKKTAGGIRLRIGCRFPPGGRRTLALGESVSVDGACLTVTARGAGWFEVFAAAETIRRTVAGTYRPGRRVNLERPLPASGRLGGHFVQGHVDATVRLTAIRPEGDSRICRFATPAGLGPLLVEKGSVALDGVSLTVSAVGRGWFEVMLIPHTLAVTTLPDRRVGQALNLEADILAKYVRALWESQAGSRARQGAAS